MLSASQEKQLADGIEDGFLENDWFCDFSDNENDEREKEIVPMAPKTEFVPLNSGIEGEVKIAKNGAMRWTLSDRGKFTRTE
jgi:hypothetical protein